MASPTIHASAVLVGARAVLIQGPSGSGKSRLALALVQAAQASAVPFARLVGDDRVHIEAVHGRLLIRPAAALAGRIEVRGLGIRNLPYEPVAVAGVVVELGPPDSERVPRPDQREIELSGVRLPRLAVAAGDDPVPILLAHLQTQPDTASGNPGRSPPEKPANLPYMSPASGRLAIRGVDLLQYSIVQKPCGGP